MAKEMNVTCDFVEHQLNCVLPANTMDLLLKVRTKTGEHTFRESVYMRTLKYKRWNNELRPFHSLKRRVTNMFRKKNSFSNSSRTTSTQTIMNNLIEQCKVEVREKDSETDSDVGSVHSTWSDVVPTNVNKSAKVVTSNNNIKKRTVRNIVLVPYKPKPSNWGSLQVKSPYATSTVASPNFDENGQIQNDNQTDKLTYVPHSPYYKPVHSPQFYGDE